MSINVQEAPTLWPTPPRDAAEVYERVRALGDLIEEEADQVAEIQHLTPRLKAALTEAGVFRMAFPAAGWGGPEARLDEQVRILESLAYHDASVAWNVKILCDGGFFVSKLPERAAREIYRSVDAPTAGSTRPAGRAVKVDGGYRLTGHWSFGSGIRDADVVYGGFYRYASAESEEPEADPRGRPQLFSCFLPKRAVTTYDAWYTTGLAGSGSTEYSVADIIVPEDWMYTLFVDDGALDQPPLSRHAVVLVFTEAAIPLGIGQRAIDEFRQLIERPSRTHAGAPMKTQDPYVPAAYAEAVALVDAARAYVEKVGKELSDILFGGGVLSPGQHGAIMQATYLSGVLCRQALEVLLETLGARSVLASLPFDRLYRDLSTIMRHTNHRRKALETSGVLMLGLDWPAHLAE